MDLNKYKDIVYKIIGASMTVHRELNWGLLEPVYNEALHYELLDIGIENEREKKISCYYKNHILNNMNFLFNEDPNEKFENNKKGIKSYFRQIL